MIAPARWAAYRAVRDVTAGRSDLAPALAATRQSLADERDRALAAEIATGTLRWLSALDHLIAHVARRPVDRLDEEVLDVLRVAAYQIVHLDRVPSSAAVNDAVEMARRAGKRSAAGLVNAALRALTRTRHALPLPPRPGDAAANREAALDYLSITLSHPRWLVARWLERYGFEAAEVWARFNNAAAPLTLRANRLKTTPEGLIAQLAGHGIDVVPGRYAPDALVVVRGNPLASLLAGSGLFFVQDEASQLVGLLARPDAGARVLDACASPGGKATAIAAAMDDRGLLVAADVRGRRLALLRSTVAASGARCIRLVQLDLLQPLPFGPVFDRVVVDAPCSGLGTIRRDPEIRWRRAETDLPAMAAAERRMLDHAAGAVKPGGRLLYATCSSEPEENEEVAAAFLHARPEFRQIDLKALALPDAVAGVEDAGGRLRTFPHMHGLEAFFAVVLERERAVRRHRNVVNPKHL